MAVGGIDNQHIDVGLNERGDAVELVNAAGGAAAEAAAVAYARYVLNPATTLELSARLATDRGGAISTWNRLSACARTVRAESPWRTGLWRSADRQVHQNFRSALRTRAPVRVSTVRTTASRTSIR